MTNEKEKIIGYLKYSGKSVEDGLLDLRKASDALLGFDEIIRYFVFQEDASLKDVDFEIPVRVKKGSWEAVLPWILTTGGGVYMVAAAKKAAEDGIINTGLAKDIRATLKASIIAAQWIIKIACHIGTLTKEKFENARINNENPQNIQIEIINDAGESLSVPKKYFDQYAKCPQQLFSKNASLIEADRILEIGVADGDLIKEVSINEKQKGIFYLKMDNGDVLFPELKHEQFVELEGEITRATESTNTIGFRYKEHVLVCRPEEGGTIAKFKDFIVSQQKDHFFPKVTRDMIAYAKRFKLNKLVIESNNFQELVVQSLEKKACEEGVYLPIHRVNNNTKKQERIFSLYEWVKNGTLKFFRSDKLLLEQFRWFPQQGKSDDGPDALEMAFRFAQMNQQPNVLENMKSFNQARKKVDDPKRVIGYGGMPINDQYGFYKVD